MDLRHADVQEGNRETLSPEEVSAVLRLQARLDAERIETARRQAEVETDQDVARAFGIPLPAFQQALVEARRLRETAEGYHREAVRRINRLTTLVLTALALLSAVFYASTRGGTGPKPIPLPPPPPAAVFTQPPSHVVSAAEVDLPADVSVKVKDMYAGTTLTGSRAAYASAAEGKRRLTASIVNAYRMMGLAWSEAMAGGQIAMPNPDVLAEVEFGKMLVIVHRGGASRTYKMPAQLAFPMPDYLERQAEKDAAKVAEAAIHDLWPELGP